MGERETPVRYLASQIVVFEPQFVLDNEYYLYYAMRGEELFSIFQCEFQKRCLWYVFSAIVEIKKSFAEGMLIDSE